MRIGGSLFWVGFLLWMSLWQAPGVPAFTGDGPAAVPAVGGPAQFRHPGFEVIPSVTYYASGRAAPATLPGVVDFQRQHAGRWDTAWDERGNRPNLIQGAGFPRV